MLIANSNNFESGFRRRTLRRSLSLGPISIRIIGILLVAAFALFYLAQSTQSAARNYKVYELEGQKEKLGREQDELELESVRLKSLSTVESAAAELGLEPQNNQ